jgi:hypothetical protein
MKTNGGAGGEWYAFVILMRLRHESNIKVLQRLNNFQWCNDQLVWNNPAKYFAQSVGLPLVCPFSVLLHCWPFWFFKLHSFSKVG